MPSRYSRRTRDSVIAAAYLVTTSQQLLLDSVYSREPELEQAKVRAEVLYLRWGYARRFGGKLNLGERVVMLRAENALLAFEKVDETARADRPNAEVEAAFERLSQMSSDLAAELGRRVNAPTFDKSDPQGLDRPPENILEWAQAIALRAMFSGNLGPATRAVEPAREL